VELRHLRYFVAVAEELHFGRAAQRLHIVQPALSKQIASLERELGILLFHRTKRRVAATEAGLAFYEEVRAILQHIEKAVERAKLTAEGEIGGLDIGFIGPAMWSLLPDALAEHHRRFPKVRFRLHELSSMIQIGRLRDGALDAAFVRLPLPVEEDVDFMTVVREPFVLTLPESYPQAAGERVNLADFAAEPFILVPRSVEPGYYDQCIGLCHSYGFTPKIIEEGNGPTAICGMVAVGLGLTLSPASILNVPWRGLAFHELDRQSPTLELAVAIRREDPSASLGAFLDTLGVRAGERAVAGDRPPALV
jgi:DNA-binding transcriptional LysR family regulator